MPSTNPRRTPEELARLGTELFERVVQPALRSEDHGKFVAIDVGSEEFEIDADDYAAVMRLRARRPDSDIWLERVGFPAACHIRSEATSERDPCEVQTTDNPRRSLAELVARITPENRHPETETGPAVGRET